LKFSYMLKYRRPAMLRAGEQLARRAAKFKQVWLQSAITQSGAHFSRMSRRSWERTFEMRKKVRNRRARYAVGYGRPPTSSQFQPGQSGNPQGRPKGMRNASSMARDALERTINIKVQGAWRKMTVRKAAYRRLGERAVAGDAKALDYLLSLESEERVPGSDQAETQRSAARISRSFKIFSIVGAPAYRHTSMMMSGADPARAKGGTNEIAQACARFCRPG
jgi:hypothetical protein